MTAQPRMRNISHHMRTAASRSWPFLAGITGVIITSRTSERPKSRPCLILLQHSRITVCAYSKSISWSSVCTAAPFSIDVYPESRLSSVSSAPTVVVMQITIPGDKTPPDCGPSRIARSSPICIVHNPPLYEVPSRTENMCLGAHSDDNWYLSTEACASCCRRGIDTTVSGCATGCAYTYVRFGAKSERWRRCWYECAYGFGLPSPPVGC